MAGIEQGISNSIENRKKNEAKQIFKTLIQKEQLVGDLYSINYETAKVIIHDKHKNNVGGIPSLSFLIATRVDPHNDSDIDFKSEDASFILLRVMDRTSLPDEKETERIRVETAQRVSGETSVHWDSKGVMDTKTKNSLSYAGVQCRIIGTFYLDENIENPDAPPHLKFGSDISNYYPNRGLKVYKPNAGALKEIINYCDLVNKQEQRDKYNNTMKVELGYVRYASTNRRFQQIDNVPVYIHPSDLLSQKTALFGMTRTGKSNTTKIIAKSVFELRTNNNPEEKPLRIGQVIFDPNGEYANENAQDDNNALKNVWKLLSDGEKSKEVVTYGITPHPNDQDRKLMLINFFLDENLQLGKEIIDSILVEESSAYFKNFVQVSFDSTGEESTGEKVRRNRRILAYRSILAKAGFPIPSGINTSPRGLFSKDLLKAMKQSSSEGASSYQNAAQIFEMEYPTLKQLASAFETLDNFIRDKKSGYREFEADYLKSSKSGESWADEDFKKIIGIFQYANGTRKIGKAKEQHSSYTNNDYAQEIYNDLKKGKLVIVDQSTGSPELNKSSAKRIITKIFKENQKLFTKGETNIPDILVYIEEAHNILPAGNELDLSDIWVRTAKEGAKYRIGMVYATQEVSSIQKNILRNTSNWFIAHLNNTDETKELCKYYDFADFELSIRRAQDKGFLRIKTLSNPFVIPVQINKFKIEK